MLHEVLFALVGCESDIIRQTPTECILAPGIAERFLHPGEVTLICRLCRLGFHYAALQRFVEVRASSERPSSTRMRVQSIGQLDDHSAETSAGCIFELRQLSPNGCTRDRIV